MNHPERAAVIIGALPAVLALVLVAPSWSAPAASVAPAGLRTSPGVLYQLPEPDAATVLRRGERLYQIHCRNCHGAEGGGEGAMAEVLRVAPGDLRGIAARNGGVFPFDRVRATIDGREEVPGHGSRSMPVWGLAFSQVDKVAEQEAEVEAALDAILAWLESIQTER